jgi:hypothetical protein
MEHNDPTADDDLYETNSPLTSVNQFSVDDFFFTGTVEEAIAFCRQQSKLLTVFICNPDDHESDDMVRRFGESGAVCFISSISYRSVGTKFYTR